MNVFTFPHERLQIKFPLCFTAVLFNLFLCPFSWILEALHVPIPGSQCWQQPKNVTKSLLRDIHPDRPAVIVTNNSAGVPFEMVNKRNVFAAAEYKILIKCPNAVNLFYKAGNREHVKGQWVFILWCDDISILDPTGTGSECILCSFMKAVSALEMFTEYYAYI